MKINIKKKEQQRDIDKVAQFENPEGCISAKLAWQR